MAIPEGYEKLAVVGIAWKGDYAEGTAYKTMNGIYYEGSTYVALRDSPTGPPSADGTNWQYLAKGFLAALLSMLTATDTSGVLGEVGADVGAQLLMDSIADKVMNKLLAKNQIVNNLLATEPGNVLDATQGKTLQDQVTKLNGNLEVQANWTLDEVNTLYTTFKLGGISPEIAVAIGISNPFDYMQVMHIPWNNRAFPTQLITTVAGRGEMYMRQCANGVWNIPKKIITNTDITLINLAGADIFYDPARMNSVFKWKVSNNLHYQLVISEQGIGADRYDGSEWVNMWQFLK